MSEGVREGVRGGEGRGGGEWRGGEGSGWEGRGGVRGEGFANLSPQAPSFADFTDFTLSPCPDFCSREREIDMCERERER